jgi:Fur family ferric uptake transcriptional regulator
MTTTTLDRQVELHLLEHEVRFTKGRRAVVSALAKAPGPKSAAELSDFLGAEVPLSSLYRTLAIFEDAGVAVHHLAAKGPTRYELAEWLTGHHHHLVCVECGSVSDVEMSETEEESVRQLVSGIARRNDFTPTDHAIEIEGRCAECS